MKNVIYLVIDSVSFERIFESRIQPSPAPFLYKLKDSALFCEKMYSMAPYTEAAVMALIGGVNTLDHGGYMKRFCDIPQTLMEAASEAGYDVYQIIQPHIYPSSLKRGIVNSFVNVSFDFNALWMYRLKYYSDLYRENRMEERDYAVVQDLLDENLSQWLTFFQQVRENDPAVSLIADNLREYDVRRNSDLLEREVEKYKAQKRAYAETLLRQGNEHPLFSIETFDQKHKIKNRDLMREVQKETQRTVSRIDAVNQKSGVAFNGHTLRQCASVMGKLLAAFLRAPGYAAARDCFIFMRYVKGRMSKSRIHERFDLSYDSYKNAPSMQKHFDHFLNWYDIRGQKDTPFFSYIHLDDIHNPEVFFTYDSEDREEMQGEFARIDQFLDKVPRNYRGSITYDLGLRYVDEKIEGFFEGLQKRALLDDTVIVITADHGFSFYDEPLRNRVPNNFYNESYHVPCLIYDKTVGKQQVGGFRCTKDIPYTALQMAGCAVPSCFRGSSLLAAAEHPYAMSEYMLGGCPDMSRRPLYFGIRSERYNVVYAAQLSDDFSKGEVKELYDLQKDPQEQRNLCRKKAAATAPQVEELLGKIEERFNEIKRDYCCEL